MKASRLLSILLLLQARGRMTAGQLARELEVSVRTVYRDSDSLHAAGVPLFGDSGHGGGYQLLDGYRTRLTGLTAPEAEALFVASVPGQAAELGLCRALADAQLKLRAALPKRISDQAGRSGGRFHLDVAAWHAQQDTTPPCLQMVANAVWRGRAIDIRYRRRDEPNDVQRRVEPYGVVLKAGCWYLVAGPGPRTYRIDRIVDLTIRDDAAEPPEDFDLATYWAVTQADFRTRVATRIRA